jgi:hypothetical protein
MSVMAEWWSIEVFHGESQAASRWKDSYSETLIESAIANGAIEWSWVEHRSGVVLEVCLPDEASWEAFRRLPAVQAALDAVPDPVNGLLVYGGRGPVTASPPADSGRGRGGAPGSRARARAGPDRRRSGRLGPGSMPHHVKDGQRTGQDGGMRDTRVAAADGMRAAIERSGYYPGLVFDAVSSALGAEEVVSYVVTHDALFDPGMEVRRHMTVLALTPTRLVYSHTDESPADAGDEDSRPQAETSTEAVRFSQISSVAVTRVIPDPASYVPGTTMPSEVVLTIGWNVLSHIELEPAHCGDDNCEADHGYTGTVTADDLTMRVSEAADGEDAVRQVLSFAQALSEATSHT